MREKLLLLAFGSGIGIGFGVLAGYAWTGLGQSDRPPEEATTFESLDDLRAKLTQRDERDVKDDASLSLRAILKPHSSDRIIYELQPNLDATFQGRPLKTNSFGMRGPETTIEKPADVIRIALLGDSFGFGWQVHDHEGFARVLERKLGEFSSKKRVELLNFSVPGYSTFQEVAAFQEKGLQFEPDIVLVFFVDNDFGLPFFIKNLAGSDLVSGMNYLNYQKMDTDQARARIDSVKSHMDPNSALLSLYGILKKLDIPLFVAVNPRKSVERDLRNLWVVRDNPEIRLINLRERVLQIVEREGINPKDLQLKRDPHPTALYHRILGELMADDLKEEVSRRG